MKSKEALIRLYIMADTPEQAIGLQDCYDVVEKDLEVLEILRKLINGLESTFNREGISSDTTILGTIIKDYFIDNDETGLVKEWLNDK